MGYRYNRWRPKPHRMYNDELPNHKFGYNCRVNPAANRPSETMRYKAECTCGWSDPLDRWMPTKRMARIHWQGHMAEVLKQQRFAV